MRKFILSSFETLLSIFFLLTVIWMGVEWPFIGVIPGLAIGGLAAGFGFMLASINDHLKAIREELSRRP